MSLEMELAAFNGPRSRNPPRSKNDLERRLGKRYDRFYNQILLGSLRDLLSEKKLGDTDRQAILAGMDRDTLHPNVVPLHLTTGTSLSGGEFYEVTFHIGKSKPKVFVKIYSDRKLYNSGKSLQEIVARLSRQVSTPAYFDDRLRLIATPFIEGETLAQRLEKTTDKEADLKQAIDLLSKIYVLGNREKFAGTKIREVTDNTNLFLNRFLGSLGNQSGKSTIDSLLNAGIKAEKVRDLLVDYREKIGVELDNPKYNRFIHGDAHPRNIICSDSGNHLIDFDLALLGKTQLDLFKLFEKSGVMDNPELMNSLLEYAYEKVKSVQPVGLDEFKRVYCLTEIHASLITAGRYLTMARDDSVSAGFAQRENLRLLASLSYTRALSGMHSFGMAHLSDSLESVVDCSFKGLLHKLTPEEMQEAVSLESSSLSSILNASVHEDNLYANARRRLKYRRLANTAKRVFKGIAAAAGVFTLGLIAYAGITAPPGDPNAYARQAIQRTISDYARNNQDSISSQAIYASDLQDDVFKQTEQWLYPLWEKTNLTRFSQKDFETIFIKKNPLGFKHRDAIYLEGAGLDGYLALLYATSTNSFERNELLKKGRLGLALLPKDYLVNMLIGNDSMRDYAVENAKEGFPNGSFMDRILGSMMMSRQNNLYDAFAEYFFGKNDVDFAKAEARRNGLNFDDINQYYRFLPNSPEKVLLARAIALNESFLREKHNEFINSKEWEAFNLTVEREMLLRESEYSSSSDLGKVLEISYDVMMKTEKYKRMLERYKNPEIALAACYDQAIVDRAIEHASHVPIRTVGHYWPASIQRKTVYMQKGYDVEFLGYPPALQGTPYAKLGK